MRISILILTAVALGCASVRGAETGWRQFPNERFGFVLTYPSSLVGSRLPDNGAGCEFHSRDGEFSVAAYAHFLRPDEGLTLESMWKDELKKGEYTVTYKKKGDTWFVVSGVGKNGFEYYHKVYTKRTVWVSLDMTYPHEKNKKYDPWVAAIEKKFVPFREGDYDRLD